MQIPNNPAHAAACAQALALLEAVGLDEYALVAYTQVNDYTQEAADDAGCTVKEIVLGNLQDNDEAVCIADNVAEAFNTLYS